MPANSTRLCSSIAMVILLAICAGEARSGVFQEGEELQYKVKFGFLRLGTIVVRTTRDSSTTDPVRYHVVIVAQSSSSIPFVHIHEYNESLIDAATLMAHSFYGKYETSSERDIVRENYDDRNRIATYLCTDVASGATLRADTIRNMDAYVDGPALFMYARANSICGRVLRVPTFIDGGIAWTTLDFTHGRELVEIGAAADPVRTRRYDGLAEWSYSSDGMTGGFTGWVSDDDAAVPIKARLKIIVGSITVELEKWKRAGWTPPLNTSAHK